MPAPLAISVGDPAGVGPTVTASALAQALGSDRALVYGDASRMSKLLREYGVDNENVSADQASQLRAGAVGLVHVVDWPSSMIEARAPTPEGGEAQRAGLDAACDDAIGGHARALVTGPVSKEAVTLTGTRFVGQTEHLAIRAGIDTDAVTMMFLGPRLKVALVGTHWPIRRVPDTITAHHIRRTVRHLVEALDQWNPSGDEPLRIEVTGLNPHAGEGGTLGEEEVRTVRPTLEALRSERPFSAGKVELLGPTPSEAAFRFAADGKVHGVVAMFHDQATIASKLLDWGHAVNVTWGLPFVRTSVDHGVAYDAASIGVASEEGMVAAIRAAIRLTDEMGR